MAMAIWLATCVRSTISSPVHGSALVRAISKVPSVRFRVTSVIEQPDLNPSETNLRKSGDGYLPKSAACTTTGFPDARASAEGVPSGLIDVCSVWKSCAPVK